MRAVQTEKKRCFDIKALWQEGQPCKVHADPSKHHVEPKVNETYEDDGDIGDRFECTRLELGREDGPDQEEEEEGGYFGKAKGGGNPFGLAGEDIENDLAYKL